MIGAAKFLYRRFELPSTKVVEVRKVSEGTRPEVVVREVDENNRLSFHEFDLRLDFLLQRGREVPKL